MITGGVYPFSLTLPEELPCSFEGRYGRVRYSIRALLDVTTIYRFSTNIIPFTVAPILDLNRDPLAPVSRNPTTGDITSGMWFHSRPPISFRINARIRASFMQRIVQTTALFKQYERSFQLPINVRQSKVYMGQTEPLELSMYLPVRGFVPGQTIPIKIDMTNRSTVSVKKIRLVFKKVKRCSCIWRRELCQCIVFVARFEMILYFSSTYVLRWRKVSAW